MEVKLDVKIQLISCINVYGNQIEAICTKFSLLNTVLIIMFSIIHVIIFLTLALRSKVNVTCVWPWSYASWQEA